MKHPIPFFAAAALASALAFDRSLAAPSPPVTVTVVLKDHRFEPATIEVPAGVKLVIDLANQDSAIEEFDSHDLRVEQSVTPHARVHFVIGPLKPGSYSFKGELHPATAQGHIIATEQP